MAEVSREEKEREKAFLESLDRMLGGQVGKPDEALDDDLKSAMRTAEHLQKLGLTPSEEFKGELKAKLLQQIYEKERKAGEKQAWFVRWLPRQAAWQAVSAVALILVVVGIMWGAGVFSPAQKAGTAGGRQESAPVAGVPTTTTTTATATTTSDTRANAPGYSGPAMLAANATTDRTAYSGGQDILVRVGLTNTSSQPITVDKFPPNLSVMKADTKQPVYTFVAGATPQTIAAGDTVYCSFDWRQQSSEGGYAGPGSYYVELEDVTAGGQTLKLTLSNPAVFTIDSGTDGTTGGAVLRTLNMSASQTDAGVTVTVQKVELLTGGARVYASATAPAGYQLVAGSSPARATVDYAASAYYSLDGGWFKDAGISAVTYFDTHMGHVWVLTEPVPADATEMLFTVSWIGPVKGTWQFTISLK